MSTGLLSGFNALSFASQVQAWWEPIILLSELSGFAMLVFALVRLARMGARQDHGGFSGVIMAALVGVLLLSLSETVGTFSSTLFGASATNPLAYAAPPQHIRIVIDRDHGSHDRPGHRARGVCARALVSQGIGNQTRFAGTCLYAADWGIAGHASYAGAQHPIQFGTLTPSLA